MELKFVIGIGLGIFLIANDNPLGWFLIAGSAFWLWLYSKTGKNKP